MIKISVIYTGVTPALSLHVQNELQKNLEDIPYKLLTYADPTVLDDVINGKKEKAERRLFDMYWNSVRAETDIILHVCSSVGETADIAQPLLSRFGISLIRIDRDMAKEAVAQAKNIGVIATLSSTLIPTKSMILDCARDQGVSLEIVEGLCDGAYGKSGQEFTNALIATAKLLPPETEIIVLAQASMADCAREIEDATGIRTLSSPAFGARAVKMAACEILQKRDGGKNARN